MPHRPAAVVDVPQVVADWLCSFGVVKAGAPVLDARGQSIVQLRAGDWADVQNGKARTRRTASLTARRGASARAADAGASSTPPCP